MLSFDDTIVAVASPPGRAARGIIRLSGPSTVELVEALCTSHDANSLKSAAGFRRLRAEIALSADAGADFTVPAGLYVFRAPRSFTGQDCAEIHTLGTPVVLGMIVARLVGAGARQAEPGEFTARAFLSGRIDLTRAEAVAQVIRARSDAQLRAARRLLDGALARRASGLLEQLAELVALVEADIDFAEEPIEFIAPAALRERIGGVTRALEMLLVDARSCARIEAVPRVLLIGRPNAGKSSLLNALSGLDRAICSAVAGTTRDILTAPVRLPHGEALLLDAAGIDDNPEPLLSRARARLCAEAATADLIVLVVDLAAEPADRLAADAGAAWSLLTRSAASESHARSAACIIAANKVDLLAPVCAASRAGELAALYAGPVHPVSAATGAGLDDLKCAIADQLHLTDAAPHADAVHLTVRHMETLELALACLRRAADQCAGVAQTAQCADTVAFDLREALDALGALCGAVTTDDLLARIFSSFCIGK